MKTTLETSVEDNQQKVLALKLCNHQQFVVCHRDKNQLKHLYIKQQSKTSLVSGEEDVENSTRFE